MNEMNDPSDNHHHGLSADLELMIRQAKGRRQVLRWLSAGAVASAGPLALVACGGGGDDAGTSSTSSSSSSTSTSSTSSSPARPTKASSSRSFCEERATHPAVVIDTAT